MYYIYISRSTDYAVPTNPNITISQVKRAIDKLASNKDPGPDEIPNHILKRYLSILQYHILELAWQNMSINHFPQSFKKTIILVLRAKLYETQRISSDRLNRSTVIFNIDRRRPRRRRHQKLIGPI